MAIVHTKEGRPGDDYHDIKECRPGDGHRTHYGGTIAVASTRTCVQYYWGHGRNGWVAEAVIGQSPDGMQLKVQGQGQGQGDSVY